MRMVTLECRECAHYDNPMPPITFSSYAEVNDGSEIQDMQRHMDLNFKARCDVCFANDWEVTEVGPDQTMFEAATV